MSALSTKLLKPLGITPQMPPVCTGQNWFGSLETPLVSISPVDGAEIGTSGKATANDYEQVIQVANEGFQYWRRIPAPQRGEAIRQMGILLRERKEPLGELVSYEMGKSRQEGLGEVQEMIDICDFAVGLSRQLCGQTMHSERAEHRMYEQWHPLGITGIISAFNFPVAVWSWNNMIASVCGNSTLWKPSEKTPLTALACFKIVEQVVKDMKLPEGIFNLIIGDVDPIGLNMTQDPRIPLISATGSTAMGKTVAKEVASRLGKTILELGGNNAIILTPHTNLKLAIPGIVFGAVGTCGQRCTTTRRLIIHDSIYDQVKDALIKAYSGLKIGDPLNEAHHVGPLIDAQAVEAMEKAIEKSVSQGGQVLFGGQKLSGPGYESGLYVMPAIIEAKPQDEMVQEETFAPILYLLRYRGELDEAISIQNHVRQGLSSALFTDRLQEAEMFLSAWGSDCGIANVNIGTSGAEIGGAFGGEKDTGGGRESGSDAWKAYMRRQTNTINFGSSLPLAQGLKFEL